MNQYCVDLLTALFRSGLALTIAAIVVLVFVRFIPIASIRLRRMMWFAVILQGCLLMQIPVTISIVAPDHQGQTQPFGPSSASRFFHEPGNVAIEIAEILFTTDLVPGTTTSNLMNCLLAMRWSALLIGGWGLGIVSLVLMSARSYVRFIRRLPPGEPVPAEWVDEWNALRAHARSRSPVTLRAVPGVGPLLCWHPRGYQLIVPADIWRLLTSQQRSMILSHELAHLERGDIWKSFALRLLALPHWFNPLVWRIVKQFDDDAEKACDDVIRRDNAHHAIEYARTLLLLGGSHQATLLAQATGGHGLADRIRRLIVSNSRKDSNMKKLAITAGTIGITLFSLLRFQTLADNPQATNQSEEVYRINGDVNVLVENVADNDVLITTPNISFESNGGTLHFTVAESPSANAHPTEAVVDVQFLFKNSRQFAQDVDKLKSQIAELERSFKARYDQAIREAANESERQLKMKEFATEQQRTSQDLFTKEREIYISTFKTIGEEIKEYAKEKGIRLVRRVDRSAAISLVNASTSPTTSNLIVVGTAAQGQPTQLNISRAASPEQPQSNDIGVLVLTGKVSTKSPNGDTLLADQVVIGAASQDIGDASAQRVVLSNGIRTQTNGIPIEVNFRTISGVAPVGVPDKKGQASTILVESVGRGPDAMIQSMLQKEVLYVEPGKDFDITREIVDRMNEKFQRANEPHPKR